MVIIATILFFMAIFATRGVLKAKYARTPEEDFNVLVSLIVLVICITLLFVML